MNKIKELIKKIREYLQRIFNKQSIKLIEEDTGSELSEEFLYDENEINETSKEEFFTLYKNVKNGIVKISDLMINDMIKVQLMMQKEVNILDEKIENMEDKISKLDTEITILEKEKVNFEKKLQ